ncbi:glycine cleavage system aminomethyltransferase GcvT [Sulfobacillus harzensis]|uniref:Aminomethyltransferase n=1 Tax=Sulfobacillus harzensis TaxID=2729629 RepID=A0A7Y0Q1C0_9FIRM|nr:glycine cleavage system aminomethyltransferase GcvT [Sulfobacillus harzensis]
MRETPLSDWHRQHGAKMMEFGGFLMPVEYPGGILEEHRTVREHVGMFDVSHMGEFLVEGGEAAGFLDRLVTNQPSALAVGQALYTPMCYPDGGTVDDLLIYRLAPERFMLVVNAGNLDKDWQWINQAAGAERVSLKNKSGETGLIALQGPEASAVLSPLVDQDLDHVASYRFLRGQVAGVDALISRTGYTGEDGFEVYLPWDDIITVWEALYQRGVRPIGLGARDTLRLEARLPLYEHELTADITPLEAGLGVFIKWDKGDFAGREALVRQKQEGVRRRLVGLQVEGGIARSGYPVLNSQGAAVGVVTSGTKSPTLGSAIALALVDPEYRPVGTELGVQVRNRTIPARVVKTPFYRRAQAGANQKKEG